MAHIPHSPEDILRENHKMLKSIQRNARISTALNAIRLLIIVIPVILAFIFLPPLYREYKSDYEQAVESLTGGSEQGFELPQGFDISDIQQFLER